MPQLLRTISLSAANATVRVLAGSAETNDATVALDYLAPPRYRGPAPHWHARMLEIFVCLEGTLRVSLDGRDSFLLPGQRVVVPPRTVHAFANPHDEPVRFLALCTPGAGMDQYFTELAELMRTSPQWPPADPTVIARLAERHDTFAPPVPLG